MLNYDNTAKSYRVLFELCSVGSLEHFNSQLFAVDRLSLGEGFNNSALLRVDHVCGKAHVQDVNESICALAFDKVSPDLCVGGARRILFHDLNDLDNVSDKKFAHAQWWHDFEDGEQNLMHNVAPVLIRVVSLHEAPIS